MTSPRPVAIGLALSLLLAACGGEAEQATPAADGPVVVATTGFAADLVRGVAGEGAEVVQLVPDAADPHSYGASARDRAELDKAALVVSFGAGYEQGLPLDEVAAERVELAEHAGELRRFGEPAQGRDDEDEDGHGHEDEDEDGHEDGHGHDGEDGHEDEGEHAHDQGSADPHVWMDPTRLAKAARGVGEALGRVEPARAEEFRERARAQARELRALDGELREILADVPEERRRLVASHESLGYFADRYDFAFVAAPFGLAAEAQASGQDVAEVIEAVRDEEVPAVFSQQGDDPKVMRRIAAEAGVEVVDGLLVEGPGAEAPTYADAMRHNARRIAEALAP
jgi:zinc/manganese transport system substrate-binding protein